MVVGGVGGRDGGNVIGKNVPEALGFRVAAEFGEHLVTISY